MTRYRLTAALAVLLLVVACSDSADTSTTASTTTTLPISIVVGTWLLDGITVAGEPYPIPVDHPRNKPDAAAPAVFEFTADGFLNGWGMCNNFRAEYEFDGRAFTFHDGYHSLMLCSAPGLNDADEVMFTLVRSTDVAVTVAADGTVMQLSLRSTTLTLHRAPES